MNQTSILVPLDGSTMAQSPLSVAEHYAGISMMSR